MGRSKGQHFSEAEIDKIAAAFRGRIAAPLVASQIGCTPRSVHRWFARFRGDVRKRGRPIKKPVLTKPTRLPVDRGPRFYKSNFEL